MKQKEERNMTWIITAVYWVIGLACVIWGGIKYINTFYGHFLIITLILPVLVALLVTFKLRLRYLINGLVGIVYLLFVIGVGLQYKMQSTTGLLYLGGIIVAYLLIAAIIVLVKTLRSREDGRYHYVNENDKKKETLHFWIAYRNIYLNLATGGVIELIFAMIFD